tara:strand:- start:40 stop:234 length:195 start_codon:yes stop_codon:yes gene_type:complete
MSMLIMLKEGGGINIDSIGTKIDEDIDLLPDVSSVDYNTQMLFWVDSGHALQYLDVDTLLLIDA